jgi:hypothetical protein
MADVVHFELTGYINEQKSIMISSTNMGAVRILAKEEGARKFVHKLMFNMFKDNFTDQRRVYE